FFASLRWRLPLLIATLIIAVLTTFLWTAYREVEHSLLQAAGIRALAASDQLALLLAQSTQQRLTDIRRAARTAAVRECVERRSQSACDAARPRIAPLAGTIQTTIEFWTPRGERVFSAAFPDAAALTAPPPTPPSSAGANPLRLFQGVI